MAEQIPFGKDNVVLATPETNDLKKNPDERTPCVLLLDVSGSMSGQRIAELNAGLQTYKEALIADSTAARRVEVAIVTFGGDVKTLCDFTTVATFHPPTLTADGGTPMAAAIVQGMEMLRRRKEEYRAHHVPCKRPWLFLITDGEPDPKDDWLSVASQVKQGERQKHFIFYAVGVEGAKFDVLRQFCTEFSPLELKGIEFRKLFRWLSESQAAVSRSRLGEVANVASPVDPANPNAWAKIPT